jgi:hypothetical protein
MVDRLSARRVLVNNTFITMMGANAIAYSAAPVQFPDGFGVLFQMGITIACTLLAAMWWATIARYRQTSQVKYRVIHEIEELLPAQPFKMEWQYLTEEVKRRRFSELTIIEMCLPAIAATLAAIGFLITVTCQFPDVLSGKVPLTPEKNQISGSVPG